MKILFIASLHHPEELRAAVADTPPGQPPPLFPPSAAHYSLEKAFRKRGHQVDVFFRNVSTFGGNRKTKRHRQSITPGKAVAALLQRIPPEANLDYRLRNRRLIEKARVFQPDVLWLTGENTVIYAETLASLKRETGAKLVYTCGTSPIVFAKPIERRAAHLIDLVLTLDYYHGIQWLELGAKRMECLPLTACDPDLHHPYELTDAERAAYRCDVTFVGTLAPGSMYSRRVRALEALRDFDLGIWSIHDVPASLRKFVRGPALGRETLKILSAAKIAFNNHADFVFYGTNIRLFEAAGVGAVQIADDLPGVRQCFTVGETIETFRDLDELRQKVAYYLAHDDERQVIARRAQAHVYTHHTYDHRVACVEELLKEI